MVIMTSPPIPSGVVTAADLYGEVTATRRDVAEVLRRVDVIDAHYQTVTAQLIDHEARARALEGQVPPNLTARLTAVERWQWKAAAVISTLAAVASVIGGYLGFLLGHVR